MTAPEAIHPGEHIAEVMSEVGITQYPLSKLPLITESAVKGGGIMYLEGGSTA